MTDTGADMRTITLEKGLATFLNALTGKNRSAATIRAYQTDIAQFISFLHANNVSIQKPEEVEKIDVMEYLSSLAKRELTGIARARKMSALREYFRFLARVRVAGKFVRKYTLRRYSLFFKEMEAKSAEFSTPS
jgi:site-specific recombinase XerD